MIKKNDVCLRRTKLDINKVIEMNLKKNDWGKIYTIYTFGSVTVTLQMSNFDFLKDKATFEYKIYSVCDGKTFDTSDSVSYDRKGMTLSFFKNYLNRKIKSEIVWKIESILGSDARLKYCDLCYYSSDIGDVEIEEAGFEEELAAIENLPSSIFDNALENLKELAQDKLNEPYEEKVRLYKLNHKYHNEDLYSFMDSLKVNEDE